MLDPAKGVNVSLGGVRKTYMLTTSENLKIGLIGLVEREWLDTINSLPPNLVYKSVAATARELVPKLRADGADIVIALTHQRQPNDDKLAENIPAGLVDMILGGHDHCYLHKIVNGTHILRSGTDFKQLSYIEGIKSDTQKDRWMFNIFRRDITSQISEDPRSLELVGKLTAALKTTLEKSIGYTAVPLDARFSSVRLKETNWGNFVSDLIRCHYDGDCSLMAAGTIRGDQIYPPGVLRLRDIMDWSVKSFSAFKVTSIVTYVSQLPVRGPGCSSQSKRKSPFRRTRERCFKMPSFGRQVISTQ